MSEFKNILRLIVVLGAICLASGLSLAGIYNVTKEPIRLQVLKNVEGPALKQVLGDTQNDPIADNFELPAGKDKRGKDVFKTIFPGARDGQLKAVALSGVGGGFEGDISVMVGIDPDDGRLTGVAVMKHSETPGIGSKITNASFTDQFQGVSVDNPTSVDGVSGATYSTKGVFQAVNKAVDYYQQHKDEILAKAKEKV